MATLDLARRRPQDDAILADDSDVAHLVTAHPARVGAGIDAGDQPGLIVLTLIAFVALWIGGLALVGMTSAWRAAVWTLDVGYEARTFGGSTEPRPGDWKPDPQSATL